MNGIRAECDKSPRPKRAFNRLRLRGQTMKDKELEAQFEAFLGMRRDRVRCILQNLMNHPTVTNWGAVEVLRNKVDLGREDEVEQLCPLGFEGTIEEEYRSMGVPLDDGKLEVMLEPPGRNSIGFRPCKRVLHAQAVNVRLIA